MAAYVIRGTLVTAVASAPLTLSEGEVLIGSAEEIEASALSRVQLAAIWNALPGTTRISRFKDRKSAARRLWAAFQELPLPSELASSGPRPGSKQAKVVGLLQRPEGATVAEVMNATGWLPHGQEGPALSLLCLAAAGHRGAGDIADRNAGAGSRDRATRHRSDPAAVRRTRQP